MKTSTYGAFVCFSPATVSGGEFLVADGAKILADLDPEVCLNENPIKRTLICANEILGDVGLALIREPWIDLECLPETQRALTRVKKVACVVSQRATGRGVACL